MRARIVWLVLPVGSTLVKRPSDDTGERPIGDAPLPLGSP